ncbi:protein nrde2 homolog [Plakobranchus ocellatus]|uniref:Protein nrde2 homolog n=1 Tax=Plakobranchus ocellatus TaxID=259542 RepID=A0AAV3ZMP9_9GAST|nr:protein nrde2 homolog [Plakobranchus ocellatus]
MATYQALIEFNLHCPSNLNLSSTKERAAEFEKFWESSMPRFGEENAFGWAKWSEQKNKGLDQQMSFVDVNLEEQEDAIIAEQLPLSQTWIKMEQLREKSHFLPWRPNTSKEETEDNAEDPERLVLFDDVYPMLFRLTKSDSCIRIICLFLKFLGMPSTILSDRIQFWEKETGSSRFEQFSKAIFVQCPELSDCYLAEEFSSEWPLHPLLLTFLSNVLLQAESYFSLSDRTFFTLLRLENEVLKNGSRKISKLPALSIKAIKRFGKSVLKESQNRNNLVIWDAYIRLLWACSDKMAETVSMIETAMAMFMGSHILNPDKKYGVCLLSLTYCQILLNFEPLEHIEATFRHSSPTPEDKQQVMSCLGALIENKVFKPGVSVEITPGYILKIRSMYERQITEYTNKLGKAQENTDFLCTLINCFALFEFCASNFDTANSIYESTRFSIKKCEQSLSSLLAVLHALLKNLYLYQLSFITNVMHIILIPRACLRKIIYEGLNEFPECSKLHSAFIKLEERSHIAGRLRQYYSKMLRNSTTLAVPLYAAASELLRHSRIKMESTAASESHDLGIMHRIRSVFEAALSHSISSHCPLLWRLYLNFEFKYGARSKAKGILYRSLQNCPWAKSIFKDGIALFGDVELQEMIDLMTEEEIRVRMPLEEIELLCTVQKKQSEDECKKIENEHDSGNL